MDPHVSQLRQLFLTHPAWRKAASSIKEGSQSRVYFSHVDGEFHLLRKDGDSHLLEGTASDPDLAFLFTPKAIERLSAVESEDPADFAVELFDSILNEEPDEQVGLRVVAGFTKLISRGYVKLLFKSGPRVMAYGKTRGVTGVTGLRKFLKQARASDPRWAQL
jgi:hypothetical protein